MDSGLLRSEKIVYVFLIKVFTVIFNFKSFLNGTLRVERGKGKDFGIKKINFESYESIDGCWVL